MWAGRAGSSPGPRGARLQRCRLTFCASRPRRIRARLRCSSSALRLLERDVEGGAPAPQAEQQLAVLARLGDLSLGRLFDSVGLEDEIVGLDAAAIRGRVGGDIGDLRDRALGV